MDRPGAAVVGVILLAFLAVPVILCVLWCWSMSRSLPPNPPNPGAVAPLRPHDWDRYRWSQTDDGTDCISSSFEEALRLQHGEGAPDLPDMEAAYRRWHPDWDDSPATLRLDWYWAALLSIGVPVRALHQLGDIVDQIVLALDSGLFPTAWVYLWDAYNGTWLHHAIVAVAHYDNWLVFYDQQRGFGWEYDKATFARTGLDGATSGYAYVATWEGARQSEVPVSKHVKGVVTADTGKPLDDLINAVVDEYGFDGPGFVGGLIGESNLHEHAVRERVWPDVSYGLSQPTVAFLHPDSGLPLARDARGVALDTPANRELVRAWAHEAGNLIPYTARRYAELIRRFDTGGDPLRTWTRWNAPGRTLEQNEAAQPHAVANYRRGLAEAEKYRAREEPDPVKIPIVYDYTVNHGARRFETRGVFIHSTRSGRNQSLEAEYRGTVSYCKTPGTVSAHAVVGPSEVTILVRNYDQAWHAGSRDAALNANLTHLGIEVCQPLPDTAYTEFQYRAAAAPCRHWASVYDFPLARARSQHEPGLIGHEDSEQGRSFGKSDPGPKWDWDRFLALCRDGATEEPAPPPVTAAAALDEIFRVAGEIANRHPDTLPEVTTIHRMVDALKTS